MKNLKDYTNEELQTELERRNLDFLMDIDRVKLQEFLNRFPKLEVCFVKEKDEWEEDRYIYGLNIKKKVLSVWHNIYYYDNKEFDFDAEEWEDIWRKIVPREAYEIMEGYFGFFKTDDSHKLVVMSPEEVEDYLTDLGFKVIEQDEI